MPSPTPTPQPTATLTLTPLPTITFTPTPIPTATPTCDGLIELSKTQRDSGNYESAIQTLEALTTNQNCQNVLESITGAIVETELAWAQSMQTQQKFAEASEKYKLAMEAATSEAVRLQIGGQMAEMHLQWAQSLASEKQYEEAYAKSALALDATSLADMQLRARNMMADFSLQLADKALAERQWDSSIAYYTQVISREVEIHASTTISVTQNNARLIDVSNSNKTPAQISLSQGDSLTTIGQYSDTQGKPWLLVLAPVFTSSLGLIAPESITYSVVSSQTLATFQAGTLPSLQAHTAVQGMVDAYHGKIQELEKEEDYPKVIAIHQLVAKDIWLRAIFPQLNELKQQALRNAYDKGMALLEVRPPEELEKYFLPILTEASDQTLVAKAKSALQIVYTKQIDLALEVAHPTYPQYQKYCEAGFVRPPLMGLALRPERQGYVESPGFYDFEVVPNTGSDESRFAVCNEERGISKGSAAYCCRNGARVYFQRFQPVIDVRVVDLITGRQMAQRSFYGSEPPYFGAYESGDIYGESPNASEINDWLTLLQFPKKPHDQIADWFSLSKEAIQAGKYDLAIISLSAVIQLNPLQYQAYWERGNAYLGQGKLELALNDMKKVLELGADKKTRAAVEELMDQLANGKVPGSVKCWGSNEHGQLGYGAAENRYTPVDVSSLGSSVTTVVAGENHTCALLASGGVKCWGYNDYGQLGDGTNINRSTPVAVSGLISGVTALAAGESHTCALLASGGVKCWGSISGSTPVDVSGLTSGVTALTAGGSHTCALLASGGAKCWGGNVSGLTSDVKALAAGDSHTCTLLASGGVKCWGNNRYGQLGDDTNTDRSTSVAVSGLISGVVALAAGGDHTCALLASGGVKCWGFIWDDQLEVGEKITRFTPVDVSRLTSGVAALAAGWDHTCALLASGGIKCWGSNEYGQLGDSQWHDQRSPVTVSDLGSSVTMVAAGGFHTCALLASGSVKCWGYNDYGQLGNGTTTNRGKLLSIDTLGSGVTALAAGGQHTCALLATGSVKCWGSNGDGQLGDGTTYYGSNTPASVYGLVSGVTAVVAGESHTCALFASGGIKCWGDNGGDQLGDGTHTNRSTPVDVSGLISGVTALAAGGSHTCALLAPSGGVKCWGNMLNSTSVDTPVDVSGLTSGVTALVAGGSHTCALLASGGVKCWGYSDYGQLGDGTNTNRSTPVAVSGLISGVTALAAGESHTCALLASGSVKCWGSISGSTPVDVSGLTSGVVALAAGGGHTCALLTSGGVRCWGSNDAEQLDTPTRIRGGFDDSSTPVDVDALGSNVTALAAGGAHTCALVSVSGH